ncbi:MAG TPA: MarR family transcriptional regulator [Acetobacteraceae bacterium]|nr:MarR family transcriptional regulator [Acetobacteraceae bacterium]
MPISRQATPGARRTAAPALADAGLCNGAALRRATRRVSLLYDQVLAPCGLRATQHAILVQLARAAEPPALGELARALVIDPSALAHNLRPLERDGFVALSANPRDQRCRLVRLTPAGRAKLAESRVLWRQAQARFERTFGPDRAARLRAALGELASDAFAAGFAAAAGMLRASPRLRE